MTSTTWPATSAASTPPSTRPAPTAASPTPRCTSSSRRRRRPPTGSRRRTPSPRLKLTSSSGPVGSRPTSSQTPPPSPPGSTPRSTGRRRTSAPPASTTRSATATTTGFEHHGFLNVLLATRRAFDGGTVARGRRGARRPLRQRPRRPGPHQRPGRRAALVHVVRLVQRDEPLDDLLALGLLEAPMPEPTDGFGLDHLPYGVYAVAAGRPRGRRAARRPVLDVASTAVRTPAGRPADTLNDFLALGRASGTDPAAGGLGRDLAAPTACPPPSRSPRSGCSLPFAVGDYVDFYASDDHASNVGRIFRPGPGAAAAQLATPAGRLPRPRRHRRRQRYAGRAPVRAAGPDRRPRERSRVPSTGRAAGSTSRPSWASWWASAPSSASRIAVGDFAEHVFGVVGLNDWSARDIQAWEYVPLGPFLGKSLRDVGQRLGDAARGARRRLVRPARPGPDARCRTFSTDGAPGASTSTSRWCSTARS